MIISLFTHVFIWLLVVLSLSLLLSHLLHRRKVSAQIAKGAADAQGILDSSAEGIVTTDNEGKIIRFNLAAENIFAYKAHNVIGKSFLFLLSEETQKTHTNIMSRANSDSNGHGYHSYELMARKSDGTNFPLGLTVSPNQEQGKHGYLAMFRDISTRKQAEFNSHRSKYLMKFLLQSSPVVFYTCNLKSSSTITYVSPNVEKLFGHTAETITGTPGFWPRHIHPDDDGHIHSSRLSGLKDGHQETEYRLKLPDNSYRWIADSRTVVNDENGKPNLLVGCWTDIHDRKDAEVKLAAKEEQLNIGLKCANLLTWDWAINSGKITWFGKVIEKLGLDRKQLTNFDDFSRIVHPEDNEALQAAFRHCLVADEALDHEYRVVWPDKSVHWIHLAGELINDEIGSPVRMTGALSDITAQKQLRAAPSLAAKRAS